MSTASASPSCFHCAEALPETARFVSVLGDAPRQFCCLGCQSVAEAIFAQGLESYYQFRDQPASRADAALPPQLLQELAAAAGDSVHRDGDGCEATLFVEGLKCAACVWLVERGLRQQDGVGEVRVQLAARRVRVRYDAAKTDLAGVMAALQGVGYQAVPFTADQVEAALDSEARDYLKRMAVAGFGMMQVMMYTVGLYVGVFSDLDAEHALWLKWSSLIATAPVIAYSSLPFFRSAWTALRNRSLNMDVSVSLGLIIAFVASCWATFTDSGTIYFESVSMFAFLLLLGRYVEVLARQRATRAAGLHQRLLPRTARKLAAPDDEQWLELPLAQIREGDCIRVLPGDTVPLDGEVCAGETSINEAVLSGESVPVAKRSGDTVLAGSEVLSSPISLRVTASGSQTYIARLARLQDEALAQRPPLQALADRLARGFVAAVLLIAGLAYAYWAQSDGEKAFEVALAVLVVTCPCALSLAMPTAWAAATQRLIQMGFLIRRASVLESLARLTQVFFDKTGTLTTGSLQIEATHCLGAIAPAQALALAAALESDSQHPIALAFRRHRDWRDTVSERQEQAGGGVSGLINGQRHYLGRRSFLPAALQAGADDEQLWLSNEQQLLAAFTLRDTLRAEAPLLVQALRGQNLQLHLASGDAPAAVRACAAQIGIDDYRARMTPTEKLQWLRERQAQGDVVLMLGDGINDVPVLAGADVSVAVGSGADFARRAADCVLTAPLHRLADALSVARKAQRIVRENLAWALAYNLVALPSAVAGWLTPWEAAIGMSLSSLLVTLNSLRLLRPLPAGPAARHLSAGRAPLAGESRT